MNNRLNVFGAILGLLISVFAIGEINNLCARLIDWSVTATREVWSFGPWHWYLAEGAWYNMMMFFILLGMLIFGVSLWFWNEKALPNVSVH